MKEQQIAPEREEALKDLLQAFVRKKMYEIGFLSRSIQRIIEEDILPGETDALDDILLLQSAEGISDPRCCEILVHDHFKTTMEKMRIEIEQGKIEEGEANQAYIDYSRLGVKTVASIFSHHVVTAENDIEAIKAMKKKVEELEKKVSQ